MMMGQSDPGGLEGRVLVFIALHVAIGRQDLWKSQLWETWSFPSLPQLLLLKIGDVSPATFLQGGMPHRIGLVNL